jgi:hypothetical protein
MPYWLLSCDYSSSFDVIGLMLAVFSDGIKMPSYMVYVSER